MAKITDPDQLNVATEIVIVTAGPKTVQLLVAGNLNDTAPGATSGVTMQAEYSKLVELWESTLAYRRHSFPIKAYTPNEMEWINTWGPADAQSRDLHRDAGWIETDGQEWTGVLTLGDFPNDADQGYYVQSNSPTGAVVDFDKTGEVNEGIQSKGIGGTPDNTAYTGVYYRVRPNFYDFYEMVSGLQLSALGPKLYSIPLGSAADPNVIESDSNIDANVPYTGMTIDYLTGAYGVSGAAGGALTWVISTVYAAGDAVANSSGRYFRVTTGGTSAGTDADLAGGSDTGVSYEIHPGEYQIGSTYYLFSRVIDGNLGTNSECYQFGSREERQAGDINDDVNADAFGAVNGQVAVHMFQDKGAGFDGTVVKMAEGVMLTNSAAAEVNNIVFFPHSLDGVYANSGQGVQFPFTVNLTFLFSGNLVGGQCTVFFLDDNPPGANLGNDFDTDSAVVVNDDVPAAMDFSIASGTINKTYDYDVNIQRGASTSGTDAPLKVACIFAGGTEPIVVDATITRVDNVEIRINAIDDRNYSNPI